MVRRFGSRRGGLRKPMGMLFLGLSATVVGIWPAHTAAQTGISRERPIKATFLYHFGQFVRWPEGCFHNAQDPFILGVLGNDPFGRVLDQIAADKKVNGRRIIIRRFASLDQYAPCHLLFVPRSVGPAEQLAVIKRLRDQPVLLVGETPKFAQRGGVMNFFVKRNKVRFEVNLQSAKHKGLQVDTRLTRIGVTVSYEDAHSA